MPSNIFAIIFFALSLLVVTPAFFTWGWMTKIALVEWGHWLGLGGIAFAAISMLLRKPPLSHALLYLAGSFFFFMPLADIMRRDVPSNEGTRLLEVFFPDKIPSAHVVTIPFEKSGVSLPIDFYSGLPVGSPRPLVIMVYGGSWTKGQRTDLAELNYFLANAGFNVAAVTYRLAPETNFPGPVDDVVAAAKFLLNTPSSWNIDPSRVYFMGRSAGGQIAEISALATLKTGRPVKGIIGLYAPADLIWGVETTNPWQIINGEISIGTYIGVPLQDKTREVYKAASPVFQVDQQTPRHLLVHGTGDELVSVYHTRTLAARLRELGRPVEVEELRWATHGFDYFYQSPNSVFLRKRILRFLAAD